MKDINGYEGLYTINEYGDVFSYKKNKYMKIQKNRLGYKVISLFKDGVKKTYTIHKLVAEAYLDNPHNLPEINHIDENKENCFVGNLEYCTHEHNMRHGTRGKRIGQKLSKKVFCVELNQVFDGNMEAQCKTGIDNRRISDCCRGKIKTAGKMHWKYVQGDYL